MFKENEEICVSNSKFGFHSMTIEQATSSAVLLVSPNSNVPNAYVDSSELVLVALNPIHGFREDENVTAYRNFLIEIDDFDIKEQLKYIKTMGFPYSAIIFSGSKSLHILVSLDMDLPNEEKYRLFSEWLLRSVPFADQKTKNPSRSIRIPGGFRDGKLKQRLVEYKGLVKIQDFLDWLKKNPEARPIRKEKKIRKPGDDSLQDLPEWVNIKLLEGLDPKKGRNQQWYGIAYEFRLCNYSLDDTIEKLEKYFEPDRDFKEKEWLTTIKSAFKAGKHK
jgi:hypothetical protein